MTKLKKSLSLLFTYFPEGRVKNTIRFFIYQSGEKSFYTIGYDIFKNVWRITTEGITLLFKKNPYHVFSTNPLFLKYFPGWKPDMIVDAGAFHGTVGLFLAKKFPETHVYLLEPDPVSFSTLMENIRLNNLTNTQAIKKGLWDKDGVIQFQNGQELSSAVVREERPGTVSIETISPATLLNNSTGKRIFFKMNVEGAELEAFPACEKLWRQNQMSMAVASDHFINDEFTFKSVEAFCKTHDIPFTTEHLGIYKTTYIPENTRTD